MKRRLPPLRPADMFAVPVIAGALVWELIKHTADVDNEAGQWPLRVLLVVGTTLLVFAVAAIVYFAVRRHLSGTRLILTLIVAVAVAAVVKGVLFTSGLVAIGVEDVPQWSFRVLSSVTHMTIVVVLLWAAMTDIRLHYERLAELDAERRELEMLREQARSQLASLDEEATESVRRSILSELTASQNSDAARVLQRLNRTIDEVVRPLSRQLESQSDTWLPPQANRSSARINWITVVRDGLNPALIGPGIICFSLIWISMAINVTRGGWLFQLEFLMVLLAFFLPFLHLTRKAAIWISDRRPTWLRPMVFVVTLLSSGLVFGIALRPFTGNFPTPWMYALLAPIFTLLVGALWGFAVSAHRQARATEELAAQSSANLRWSITRARELHRQRRRALAHAVHGQVQATLAAAILQLDNALRDGTATDEAVKTIQGQVVECVADLDMRNEEPSSVEDVAARTRATWAGVADIELTIDPSVDAQLRHDPQTLMTLNDVIPELVFNSIKHGKAKHININITQDTARTLTVVVTDDGHTTTHEPTSGLGSRLLDDCAMRWNRQRSENKTVTEVVLTLAVEENVAAHVA